MILKMEAPDLGFAFEWHPEARALYSVNYLSGGKHEQIAGSIVTPEMAQLATMLWCRGYRSRAREITRSRNARHYQLLAEGGVLGTDSAAGRPVTTTENGGWRDDV